MEFLLIATLRFDVAITTIVKEFVLEDKCNEVKEWILAKNEGPKSNKNRTLDRINPHSEFTSNCFYII